MIGRSGTAICAQSANPGAIKRGRRLPYCLLLIALLLGAAILQRDGGARFPTAKTRSTAQWAHLYAALPLSFEANSGQTDPSVSFLSRGQGYTLFLTGREAVLTLKSSSPTASGRKQPDSTAALRLQLMGANDHPAITGKEPLPGKVNYFIGNDPNKWRRNVPTYAKVKYQGVYPGVDLVYYGAQGGELEYDFVIAPGADPKLIALGVETENHTPLRINAEGDLVVALPNGDVRLHKPIVYQTASDSSKQTVDHGRRTPIEGRYALDAQNHVHFELGPYDHNHPLVVDPVLSYATYIGGTGGDVGYSIAVDSLFDAYIAGQTNSTGFPTTGKPYQSSSKGNGDCFVTKINSTGTQLIYSTYLGGSGTDAATALALVNGSVFLTGYTASSDFPAVSPVSNTNPFQLSYGGSTDAFVAQLDATGSTLVYSSYLGGSGQDVGQGIAVDSSGYAYVTGSTQSTNFPVTPGALQSTLNGSQNAFVTKVNLTGEALVYSTYLGGSAADVAQSIQLDSTGDAYLAGYTYSANFPTVNPYQRTNMSTDNGPNAFVAELNAAGTTLTFSTYLGGSGNDRAYGLALDNTQNPNIYVTGGTSSTNFPTTTGAFQSALDGLSDAFVTKLNPTGSSLLYSTYLGGSGVDQGNAIAVIPSGATNTGAVFVTGFTQSSDFPTQNPIQSVLGLSSNTYCGSAPCADAFVTQLNAAGNALTYSTYLGGDGPDFGQGIALDTTGDPYITGSTSSTNFPAVSPPQSNTTYVPPYNSSRVGTAGNAFIAKIDSGNNPNISILPGSLNFGNETISVPSNVLPITIVNPSTVPLVITQIQIAEVNNSITVYTETDNCVGTLAAGGAYCTIYVTFTPNATGTITDTITLTDNAGGVPGTEQTINLTGAGVTAATAVTVQPTSLSFSSTAVGSISPPQSVTITNTGTEPLSINSIGVGSSLDYAETSATCLALQNLLAVGQSCTVSVTFTPTASGTRNASLSISDNATGSPQTVALTGIGAAAFTLSSPSAGNPTIIGSTQTTFTIVANGTNFTGAITLACSSGTAATCTFSQNPIFVGGVSSIMTVSNLSAGFPNPYIFSVTGTSGSQTTTLQLSLGFSDYTLTASPVSVATAAGTPVAFTIYINPLNGFTGQVQLAVEKTVPALNATYTYSPNSSASPNGTSPAAIKVQVTTQTYVAPPTNTHAPPRFPGGKLPPIIFGLLCFAGLASLALGNRRRAHYGWMGSRWMAVRLATLSLILTFNLAFVACRSSTLVNSGTVPQGYVITFTGTMSSNASVIRTVVVDLSVTASNPT